MLGIRSNVTVVNLTQTMKKKENYNYDMYAMNEWFNLYNNKERYESNEIILIKNELCNRWNSELMYVHIDTYKYGIFN